MRIVYILILTLVTPIISPCQTEALEKELFNALLTSEEIDAETASAKWKRWQETLEAHAYPAVNAHDIYGDALFTQIIDVESMDQSELFERCKEWVAVSFGSIAAVLHYESPSQDRLIVKGSTDITHVEEYRGFFRKRDIPATTSVSFVMIFTIKEEKIKIQFNNIAYQYKVLSFNTAQVNEVSVSLFRHYPIILQPEDKWVSILSLLGEGVQLFSQTIPESLQRHLLAVESDYKFY